MLLIRPLSIPDRHILKFRSIQAAHHREEEDGAHLEEAEEDLEEVTEEVAVVAVVVRGPRY